MIATTLLILLGILLLGVCLVHFVLALKEGDLTFAASFFALLLLAGACVAGIMGI